MIIIIAHSVSRYKIILHISFIITTIQTLHGMKLIDWKTGKTVSLHKKNNVNHEDLE